jgi:hypothetical protein
MLKWPDVIALEALLAFASGAILSRGEARGIRPLRVALALVLATATTLMLMMAWWLDVLPFSVPVANWYSLMILTGVYEASGFLAAAVLVPWAPIRTRCKIVLAVLAGAIVVGHLTYSGGDLMMMPTPVEQVRYFARGTVLATAAATIGYFAKRQLFRILRRDNG